MSASRCRTGGVCIPLALVIPLLRSRDWMRRYQFIQEKAGRIRVKLVAHRQPTGAEVADARRVLESVTGDGVEFAIEIVDRIDRHPSGKLRPYFSLLPADPRDAEIGVTKRRSSGDDRMGDDRMEDDRTRSGEAAVA